MMQAACQGNTRFNLDCGTNRLWLGRTEKMHWDAILVNDNFEPVSCPD